MPVNTTHKQYDANKEKWERCRDVISGADAVKAAGVKYLPALPSSDSPSSLPDAGKSDAYTKRANFYNATGRTVDGLTGTVFRKVPVVSGVPKLIEADLDDVTLNDTPIESFAMDTLRDVIGVGRFGTLLDMAPESGARPYWVPFKCEQIVNWREGRVNGERTLLRVVLREELEQDDPKDEFKPLSIEQYRVCALVSSVYTVTLYRQDPNDKNKWLAGNVDAHGTFVAGAPPTVPLRRGATLTFIPFVCFGPLSIDLSVEPSPLLDLVDVNLSHYRSSADLEHGRHFTALPTPYICGYNAQGGPLVIGSGTAWTFANSETKVGMLEFTGDGLKTLERTLEQKEAQMATLGGRMLEGQKAAAETAQTVRLRVAGEHSALKTAALSVGLGLSKLVQMHAWWAGIDDAVAKDATVTLNQQFLDSSLTPQEITALMGLYQAGGISFQTLYFNLQRGEIAQPDVDVDAEQLLIDADTARRAADAGAPVAGGNQADKVVA